MYVWMYVCPELALQPKSNPHYNSPPGSSNSLRNTQFLYRMTRSTTTYVFYASSFTL